MRSKSFFVFVFFSLSHFSFSFLTAYSFQKKKTKNTAVTPLCSPSEPARSSRVRRRREEEKKSEKNPDGARETRSLRSHVLLLTFPFPFFHSFSSLSLSFSLFHIPPRHNFYRLGRRPQRDVRRREAQAQDPLGHGLRCVFFFFLHRDFERREREKKLTTLLFSLSTFEFILSTPNTGAMGSPPKIPGGATLIFETELMAINGKP